MEKKITLKPLPFDRYKHQVYLSNVSSAWIIASQYYFPLRGTRAFEKGLGQESARVSLDQLQAAESSLQRPPASGQRAAGHVPTADGQHKH